MGEKGKPLTIRPHKDLERLVEASAKKLGSKTAVIERALEQFFADDGTPLAEENQTLRARIEELEARNEKLAKRVPERPTIERKGSALPPKKHACEECGKRYRYAEVAEQCALDDRGLASTRDAPLPAPEAVRAHQDVNPTLQIAETAMLSRPPVPTEAVT